LAAGQSIVGFGYAPGVPVTAPGAIVTLLIYPALNVPDAIATGYPLPKELSGVSVLVRVVGAKDATGYPSSLSILRILSGSEITVQIPLNRVCAPAGGPEQCPPGGNDLPPSLVLNVEANGIVGPDMLVEVEGGAAHLLNSCDSILGPSHQPCYPLITHGDGTLVNASSPAAVGETITFYAVGVGESGGDPPSNQPIPLPGNCCGGIFFIYDYPLPPGSVPAGANVSAQSTTFVDPDYVGVVPGYVGLYQFNARVPPVPGSAATCPSATGAQVALVGVVAKAAFYVCTQP
jgi:uncharacterized protein (TIGR03437 family)